MDVSTLPSRKGYLEWGAQTLMPLYDFLCPSCKVTTERLVRHREEVIVCPQCGRQLVQLPASPFFKISGYSAKNGYSTDSPSGKLKD